MPMISSDADNAPGTVYYAVAMTGVAIVGCFVPEVMLPFGVGIFATSIGDGFAGLVGQSIENYNPKIYGNKSLFGSLTNFICTFISAFIMNCVFIMKLQIWHIIFISLLAVSLELVTGWGLDNISITWGVTALTYGFMYFDNITNYLVPILLTPFVIAFAIKKNALTKGGVLFAIVIDILISVSLGNFGFVLLVSFFVLAICIDRFKKRIKKSGRGDESEKGDCRDYMQVCANGLLAAILSVLAFITNEHVFLVSFAATLAEAMADTAASGFGIAARVTVDPWKMKRCEGGISGGMSVIGTFASFVGAYVIAIIAYAFGEVSFPEVCIITLAGFSGGIFDSFLGSLVQVKYKCTVCEKITEKRMHCGEPTLKHSGLSFIDNDGVNILSGFFAAVISGAVMLLLG